VADFGAQFTAAMTTLSAGSPNTKVLVVSIPRVTQLWELFKSNLSARFIWSAGRICQSLLANPTSTQATDVARRAQVAQRNIDYNAKLAEICAKYAQCRFDGNAVYNVVFAKADVSGDYFHPSIAGQAKLSAVTWTAGYWPNGGPVTDVPPTAAFTASCTGLVCTFDASGSTDDHDIAAYGWTFGDGATGAGVTASHTFATAGTYTVTLAVTDTAAQTGTVAKAVTVTAPTGAVHLASATGMATPRKSGWIATISVWVKDGLGGRIGGATVSGTWSTGGSGTCVTSITGDCSFSANVSRKTASVTWSVGNIAAAGYGYDPTANVGSPFTITAVP
jgi:PKD repeat protein